jgi:hypothetical protein
MKKSIIAAALGAVLAAGVMMSPMAHADANSTFLQAISNAGFWAGQSIRPSDKTLEDEASAVCSWKSSGQTPDNIANVVQGRDFHSLTIAQATQFVTIAISAYCP